MICAIALHDGVEARQLARAILAFRKKGTDLARVCQEGKAYLVVNHDLATEDLDAVNLIKRELDETFPHAPCHPLLWVKDGGRLVEMHVKKK